MVKQHLYALGLAVGAALSQQAFAADSGFYADIGVGYAKADLGSTAGFTVDDTDTSYSLGLGYNFNKNISVEGGYLKLGKASLSSSGSVSGTYYGSPFTATGTLGASAEVDGFYLGPVFRYPVTEKIEILGRVGAYIWEADLKASASGSLVYAGTTYAGNVSASKTEKGTDAYYGLGLNYKLNDRIGVGMDWTRFDIDGTDVDNISARLKISF
ncbi:MAG: outer membrane beta-barrel protein [Burkholderiales bacterium]|nr:outer membrane beta-barrel protein [Burkholderiales bacterium]